MNYELLSDSCSNLTEEMIDSCGVQIISLLVRANGKEYRSYIKGEKTDIKMFYDMMRNGTMLETTQLDMHTCREYFEPILKQGKDLLYLAFSSGLSGTYHVACMVAKELQEEYPDRKIYVVDSLSASMGQGLLLYLAAQKRLEGMEIDQLRDWIMQERLHLCHWFTVDDLNHLKRGGRVSATTALVGSMLGIKPILHVDDAGKLINVGKARGRMKSLDALVEHMAETAVEPANQTVFISHGDSLEDAQYVERQVRERFQVKDIYINYIDPVIGAHSGPGTIALFFLGTHR